LGLLDKLKRITLTKPVEEIAKQALNNAHFCSSINECIEKAEVIFIGTANYSNIKSKKPIVNPWK